MRLSVGFTGVGERVENLNAINVSFFFLNLIAFIFNEIPRCRFTGVKKTLVVVV